MLNESSNVVTSRGLCVKRFAFLRARVGRRRADKEAQVVVVTLKLPSGRSTARRTTRRDSRGARAFVLQKLAQHMGRIPISLHDDRTDNLSIEIQGERGQRPAGRDVERLY